jgi:tRNA uridine 5-carbamoylmethylation protein Kti12
VLDFFSSGQMAASPRDAVLVLVCGLPAAGKTTLVKRLVASSDTRSRLYERVSFDDLFEDAGCKPVEFDPERWKACQQEMAVRVSQRIEEQTTSATGNATTQQLVLLVDDNFQYRSLRKRFFNLATEREEFPVHSPK